MEVRKLAISIQPKITGKKVLMMAWINLGTHQVREKLERNFTQEEIIQNRANPQAKKMTLKKKHVKKYDRIIVSTGVSIPFEFWNAEKRTAKPPYQNSIAEAEAFKEGISGLFDDEIATQIISLIEVINQNAEAA